MIRAEYDSAADALQIYLIDTDHWVDGEDVCGHQVDYAQDGTPAGIELLNPSADIPDLAKVAAAIGADGESLISLAEAAIATPNRMLAIADNGEIQLSEGLAVDDEVRRLREDANFQMSLTSIMERDRAILDRLAGS